MQRKKYNRYTSFADRFPLIIVAFIMVCATIFTLQFKEKFPLPFFSGSMGNIQETKNISYSIIISSPSDGEVFNFLSEDETVPIKVRSSQIEESGYRLNLVVDDKDIIKTFNSTPYTYNWKPQKPGEYLIIANLVDNDSNVISTSNKVKFTVEFKYEKETLVTEEISSTTAFVTEETATIGIPTIKLEVFEGPTYSSGDDICYYRIRAIVTGDPVPTVSFSKDDSKGAWGALNTQINLTRASPNYTLTAIAKNSTGQAMDSLTLTWGCGN